jgi:hypothetical protein
MAKKHITISHNRYKVSFNTMAILIAIVFFSCDNQQNESSNYLIKRVSKVAIEENEHSSLHYIPKSLHLLNDSLICLGLYTPKFSVYNYKTGKIEHQIALDTGIVPTLLTLAQENMDPRFRLMTNVELKENSIPLFRIASIFYDKNLDNFHLFFVVTFGKDTTMEIKGKIEPSLEGHSVIYTTTLNNNFVLNHDYKMMIADKVTPMFLFTGYIHKNNLILPNFDPFKAGDSSIGLLSSVSLNGEKCIASNLMMPFDNRSINLQKRNTSDKISFAHIDENTFFVSDAKRIMKSDGSKFTPFYNVELDNEEHIQDLYYNKAKNRLYVYSSIGSMDEVVHKSKVSYIEVATKKRNTVDSVQQFSSFNFLNDVTALSIQKKDSAQSYEFVTYKY